MLGGQSLGAAVHLYTGAPLGTAFAVERMAESFAEDRVSVPGAWV
jgi:hypothetical protein